MAFEKVLTRNVGNPAVLRTRGYRDTGGYDALSKALRMAPEEVIEEVKRSGLRGRGGAGFPCGMKWSFVPRQSPQPKYIVCNADESEPGTFKDRLLMEFDPHQLLEGCVIAGWAVGANTTYIYIRGEYTKAASVLEEAVRDAYASGILGDSVLGTGFRHDIHVHRGAGAYICGEETGLLESLEGKRGWPRIKPPFPAVKGLFGKPTIINNVETLCCVPFIIEHGVEWFKSLGCASKIGGPPSFGTKLMGVSGHVQRPGVYECDLGIPLRRLVEEYCGGMRGGKRYKAAIAGGVSMGVLGTDQFDAEMDFDIGRKYEVLGLGTACPTIFDEDTDMVMVARNIARFFKNESCGQCTPCREGSGWMYKLLCRMERGEAKLKDIDLLLELAGSMGAMPGTTICGLADGNNWAVRTIVNKFRSEFEARCSPSFVPVTVGVA